MAGIRNLYPPIDSVGAIPWPAIQTMDDLNEQANALQKPTQHCIVISGDNGNSNMSNIVGARAGNQPIILWSGDVAPTKVCLPWASNSPTVALIDGGLWICANAASSGSGKTTNVDTFSKIGTDTWIDIAAGQSCGFAVRSDGTLWSWGTNTLGRTGQSLTAGVTNVPTQIGSATNWTNVWAGGGVSSAPYAFALNTSGEYYGWGLGIYTGTNTASGNVTSPTINSSFPAGTVLKFMAGWAGATAFLADGTIWSTGVNTNQGFAITPNGGNKVIWTQSNVTSGLTGGTTITDVWTNYMSLIVKQSDGTFKFMGYNGGLGSGNFTVQTTWANLPPGNADYIDIQNVGWWVSVFRRTDHSIYTCYTDVNSAFGLNAVAANSGANSFIGKLPSDAKIATGNANLAFYW